MVAIAAPITLRSAWDGGRVAELLSVAKRTTIRKRARERSAGSTTQASADREDLFVPAYLANGFNRTAAAIAAGFAPATAANQGRELYVRHRERIQSAIKERKEELFL